MENKDLIGDTVKDLLGDLTESHSQPQKEAGINPLRRDNDSVDDFEHLEHDVSPVKEVVSSIADAKPASPVSSSETPPPRVVPQVINTTADSVAETASKIADDFTSELNKVTSATQGLIDSAVTNTMSTASDLLDMGEVAFKPAEKTSPSAADLLADLSYAPPVPPHAEPVIQQAEDAAKKAFGDFDNFKSATQSFMDTEREEFMSKITSATDDLPDRFSDSEPEADDFKQSSEDFKFSSKLEEDFFSPKSVESTKTETFKDVIDEPEPELPKRDYFEKEPSPVKEVPTIVQEPVKVSETIKAAPEPKPTTTPSAPVEIVAEPEPEPEPLPVVREAVCPPKSKKSSEVIAAEAMFCKMGLDAWFNPERLNPKVESLIYWRDPRKSGAVFGGTLVVLLSLAYFSLISVAAYLSLLALAGTISFRIYKNVLQAVQKTADGHPFKELLEADLTLPQEKVREFTEVAVTHVNAAVTELRRLFLVEDLVDSIKFGVLLWCLTYVGAWFNGMTLIIIAFVALFTLPKVYENNKTQIDANLDIVRTKLAEITSKVKAAIPIGKKSEEKKEQ